MNWVQTNTDWSLNLASQTLWEAVVVILALLALMSIIASLSAIHSARTLTNRRSQLGQAKTRVKRESKPKPELALTGKLSEA